MLDAFIVEEIRRRQNNNPEERPFLELPLPQPNIPKHQEDETESKRVIIIDTMDDPVEDKYVIDL